MNTETMNFAGWQWLNESEMVEINGELAIVAPPRTDWFNNPVPEDGVFPAPVANAPFLYTEVSGDFVFRARVRPNHRYTYDACALMVIKDEQMWAKAAFEASDFGTRAAVCSRYSSILDFILLPPSGRIGNQQAARTSPQRRRHRKHRRCRPGGPGGRKRL